jgi:cysteine synthase A
VLDVVGGTPLVKLNRLPAAGGAAVLAKMESLNPGGSVGGQDCRRHDRGRRASGLLKRAVVVEPTSGNTGIGLAMVCAVRGYRLHPDHAR